MGCEKSVSCYTPEPMVHDGFYILDASSTIFSEENEFCFRSNRKVHISECICRLIIYQFLIAWEGKCIGEAISESASISIGISFRGVEYLCWEIRKWWHNRCSQDSAIYRLKVRYWLYSYFMRMFSIGYIYFSYSLPSEYSQGVLIDPIESGRISDYSLRVSMIRV